MDLHTLSLRTGFSVRKLRYCLDHGLVPGLRIELTTGEAGRPRKFHEDVGFGLTCAATLLDAGFNRSTVRAFLKALLCITLRSCESEKLALVAVLEGRLAAVAEFGDGMNIRVVVGDWDSGWQCPTNPAPLAESYRPTTYIGLDLGQIRDDVYGR